jgi:hypothetical protein
MSRRYQANVLPCANVEAVEKVPFFKKDEAKDAIFN